MADTATDLLDELIHLIATVCGERPVRTTATPKVKRDPQWRLHRAQAVAAVKGRELCGVYDCLRVAPLGEDWCRSHYPDDVAIERAMRGEPLELMPHERHEAVRRLHQTGHGWNTIQERLGVSGRTIAKALTP